MATTYCYYAFGEVLHMKKSKTAIVYTALRTIEPALPDYISELNAAREQGRIADMDANLRGLYCLRIGKDVVSVALVHDNKLDRIITIPKYRRQGYALQLIKHIAEQYVEHECPIILAPVDPRIAPLFDRAGWVRTGTTCTRDGTIDYTLPEMLPLFGIPVEWDRRGWSTHLLFLQTHLFKPKSEGAVQEGKKMMDYFIKQNS